MVSAMKDGREDLSNRSAGTLRCHNCGSVVHMAAINAGREATTKGHAKAPLTDPATGARRFVALHKRCKARRTG